MKPDPYVSIIIPVYNGSNYLRKAIDSALAQTHPSLEVIVVNDGSDDEGQTEVIASSYDTRIRYFSKANGGVATALNFGINNMRGQWFAWLSHDDLFSPNRIATDMHLFTKNPDARVSFCKLSVIDAQGIIIHDFSYPIESVTNPREALLLGGVNMCSMTIHKSCFVKTGLFNESNRTTQDVEMTLRLATAFPFYFNSNGVTYSREHSRRGTHVLAKEHKRDLLRLSDFIHNELTLQSFFPNLRDDENEILKAWAWMAELYRYFGATHYADECISTILSYEKNTLRRWLRIARWRMRKLDNPIVSKLDSVVYHCYKSARTKLFRNWSERSPVRPA